MVKNTTFERKGAFGELLLRCIVYIDMNMVRARLLDHPRDWVHAGYVEIQNTHRKCILIDYEKLCQLAGYSVIKRFQKAHLKWVNAVLTRAEPRSETRWPEANAVGDESFVGFVKGKLTRMQIPLRSICSGLLQRKKLGI